MLRRRRHTLSRGGRILFSHPVSAEAPKKLVCRLQQPLTDSLVSTAGLGSRLGRSAHWLGRGGDIAGHPASRRISAPPRCSRLYIRGQRRLCILWLVAECRDYTTRLSSSAHATAVMQALDVRQGRVSDHGNNKNGVMIAEGGSHQVHSEVATTTSSNSISNSGGQPPMVVPPADERRPARPAVAKTER